MAYSLNRVMLIGRLGRTPEMRYTGDGLAVTRFNLATDRPARPGADPEPEWHRITCWGKLAEFSGTYLTKGRLVYVAGRISYRNWLDKDGLKHNATEVVASELIVLDPKPESLTSPTDAPAVAPN
jgi:single-strand DNA-binding protein